MAKPEAPLILASQSMARRKMLEHAGLLFSMIPADIDEKETMCDLRDQNISAAGIALELSKRKALNIAQRKPKALIVGADQVLEFEGKIVTKARSIDEAREKLSALKGKSHRLVSAVTVAQGETALWQNIDEAVLTMHDFDEAFLEVYIKRAGKALMRSVGGYELESHGAWLFSSVMGNYFTILGLPLLPLLAYLKSDHGYGP